MRRSASSSTPRWTCRASSDRRCRSWTWPISPDTRRPGWRAERSFTAHWPPCVRAAGTRRSRRRSRTRPARSRSSTCARSSPSSPWCRWPSSRPTPTASRCPSRWARTGRWPRTRRWWRRSVAGATLPRLRLPAPGALSIAFMAFVVYALITPESARRWEGHPGNEPKTLRMAVALGHGLGLDVEGVYAGMEGLTPRPVVAAVRDAVAGLTRESVPHDRRRRPDAAGSRRLRHPGHARHAPDHPRQGGRRLPRPRPRPFAAAGAGAAPRPRAEPRPRHARPAGGDGGALERAGRRAGGGGVPARARRRRGRGHGRGRRRWGGAAAAARSSTRTSSIRRCWARSRWPLPCARSSSATLGRHAAGAGSSASCSPSCPGCTRSSCPCGPCSSSWRWSAPWTRSSPAHAGRLCSCRRSSSAWLFALYNFGITGSVRPDALFLAWGPAGVSSARWGQGLFGLALDARYGLLPYVPVYLLALARPRPARGATRLRRRSVWGLLPMVAYYLTVAAADNWSGAVCNLGRYVMPSLPSRRPWSRSWSWSGGRAARRARRRS